MLCSLVTIQLLDLDSCDARWKKPVGNEIDIEDSVHKIDLRTMANCHRVIDLLEEIVTIEHRLALDHDVEDALAGVIDTRGQLSEVKRDAIAPSRERDSVDRA